MMGRAERIGDRLVAGVITAAFIRGIAELASADNERFGRWERPLMGIALGMSTALGGYLGWTARRSATSAATLTFTSAQDASAARDTDVRSLDAAIPWGLKLVGLGVQAVHKE